MNGPIGGYWPLYADGTPVRIGDLVMGTCGGTYGAMSVESVTVYGSTTIVWGAVDGITHQDHLRLLPGEYVERVETDSWERLEADAGKGVYGYWPCHDARCEDCPVKVDGKDPTHRYGTTTCNRAMLVDIIRRAKALAGVVE